MLQPIFYFIILLMPGPPIFLWLFFFLFVSQISNAQKPAAKNEGFQLYFEKVYLHLDRSQYASGDDIWFKAYLVNGQTNRPTATSNSLYVELIDPNASLVSRKLIRLDSAVGTGDFKLENAVLTGTYRLRAYTNWMRNFGHRFVFEKEIQVVNIPEASKDAPPSAALQNKNKKPATNQQLKSPVGANKIQFFPEGGFLVDDVPTRVAFKAEDANGKSISVNGFVLTSNGDTVVKFVTTHAGMGSFPFTPRKGTLYKVVVQYGKDAYTEVNLPATLPSGLVMTVEAQDTSGFVVNIQCNPAMKGVYPSGSLHLAARHAGKSYFKQSFTLNNGKATIAVPVKDFPVGIAYLTLYDSSLRPHCERLVYVERESGLTVTVIPDKPTYGPKEKATVLVSVTDKENRPVKTALSFAAVDEKLDVASTGSIQSYLLLQSNLPGKIEQPESYFDPRNENRKEQLDLLLMAQGWRSFLWRQMTDSPVRISYLPEAGITISGTVTKPWTRKPMQDMHITLFAPDARGDKIYMTKTNEKGKYYLEGLPLFGISTVKINVSDGIGKEIGSLAMDSLSDTPLPILPKPFYTFDTSAAMAYFSTEASRRWSTFRNTNMLPGVTISTAKGLTLLNDGSMVTSFGYPEHDFTITPQDRQYPTLRDFLVQKVPGAYYDENLEGITFVSEGKHIRPIFIVDSREDRFGRMDYYHLGMEQVESVRVRHLVGSPGLLDLTESEERSIQNLGIRGFKDYYLIFLKVKFGNADQQLSKITTNVTGYYESRAFYSPNYSTESEPLQDERITIHWSPLLRTDENGKAKIQYYNADPKGKIRLTVQGMTFNGTPVVANTVYEVKQ